MAPTNVFVQSPLPIALVNVAYWLTKLLFIDRSIGVNIEFVKYEDDNARGDIFITIFKSAIYSKRHNQTLVKVSHRPL